MMNKISFFSNNKTYIPRDTKSREKSKKIKISTKNTKIKI